MISRNYNDVALLITHYNRSGSLKRLLNKFRDLNFIFGEIIVSDDGSRPEHFQKLQELEKEFEFKLIATSENKGLGNNINKGQDAVTKPYTLYVQEDFVPKDAFIDRFEKSLEIMQNHIEIDIVRYYGYVIYPYSKPFEHGFRLMNFNFLYPGYFKFYVYSDHPHLRRSNFFDKFGRYMEGVNGDVTEYNMCLSFLKNDGQGIFYPGISDLFDQLNNADEPSTASFRQDWKLSPNILIKTLRLGYLQYKTLKFHIDLLKYPEKQQ